MLKEFVEKKHYKFAESAKDWRDAIRMSCEVLEADGTVEGNYKEDIIKCVEKYGPYIVIMPGLAMPHSQEFAEGVHKTEIAFMKLEQPVSFDPDDPDKDAVLFSHLLPAIRTSIWTICQDLPRCFPMKNLWRS